MQEKTAHCTEMSLVSAATSRSNLHVVDKDGYKHMQIGFLFGGQLDEFIRPDGLSCVTKADWGAWAKQYMKKGVFCACSRGKKCKWKRFVILCW
jgi:hypothetical protein